MSRLGLRPCSGAILVLVFALAQGLFWAGIAATFMIGLGTAITVATIAVIAVSAKGLARRLSAGREGGGALIMRGIEFGAAGLVGKRPSGRYASTKIRRKRMAKLNINGKVRDVQVEADTPLLWVIREQVGLTGTKYGCGVAQCGACSVHINGEVQRSCSMPVGDVKPTDMIVTIEGCRPTARIRCRRRGPRSTCRNAAIASPARSWRPRRCSRRTRSRPTRTSTTP